MAGTAMQAYDPGEDDADPTNWRAPNIDRDDRKKRLEAAYSLIVDGLAKIASEQVNDRAPTEERWLEDLRQFHSIYEDDVAGALANDAERSKAFINYTRPKTTAWAARLFDLLFPADDKNWGISPTPVPDLVEGARDALREADEAEAKAVMAIEENNAMVDNGSPPEDRAPLLAQAEQHGTYANSMRKVHSSLQKVLDEARRRCELMEREIDDQLTECNFPAQSRIAITDACKLGVGVIKGPIVTTKTRGRWTETEDGGRALQSGGDPKPSYRRVNPWNFFPDSSATDMDDCEFTFERHLPNATKLRKMAKELGFDKNIVRRLLTDGPGSASQQDLNHLTQLRSMHDEGSTSSQAIKNRYIVWEYHGPLPNDDVVTLLIAQGKFEDARRIEDEMDPMKERRIVCYFCDGEMLKIAPEYPMDSGETLYNVFSFEKSEASILGAVGVPRLMRHEQAMLNSAVRMMVDNGALSIGPQTVIDKSQIEPENGKWQFAPRKVWLKKGQEVGTAKPFDMFNIPMNQAQIAGIIELALKFIDDVISMPMIAQGDQGQATDTLGGMSMLFNSANVVFRRVVKNWDDDVTEGVIRRAYDWNMQFNPKEEVKGDANVEARGTSVLLVREIQSQQLMAIAMQWSQHPIIGPAVRVYEALSMTLQAMAINPGDILVERDEFEQKLKAMAESAGEETTPESIRAEASIKVAEITAQTRMAETQLKSDVAEMNRETAILELMVQKDIDIAKVQAMLAQTKIRTDSDERKLAAEVGIEAENARRAAAMGREATGSGGAISLGSEPAS